ncbi:MAG: alpha/beta hydrolase [Rhizobiaceae bacterium]|nr:alpha/beta hydrolase [Rhizobiaceae bacterium]
MTIAAAAQPVSREVEATVADGTLRGTLLAPAAASKAAAVIVAGSGPTDRNGNSPLGISASTYRMLAEALAERGVATVRYDKRGIGGSAAVAPDANAVTVAAFAGDAAAWIEVARREVGTPCAWLVGHSEGGLMSLVAAQDNASVCGLVLLSAPGRRFGDLLRDQLWSNPANWFLMSDALRAIAALERGEKVDVSGMHEALQRLFYPGVQGYLIDLFSRDPAALAAAETRPMLIVQGGNDIQVKRLDFDALAAAQPKAETLFMLAMNHVLKDVPENDPAANIGSYSNPDLPLAAGLADELATFLTRRR